MPIVAETRNERIALSAVNSGACQDAHELARLLDLAEDAEIILEIGTHGGRTFSALSWAAPRGAILISVDIAPPHTFGVAELATHCAPERTIVQIIGDSADRSTINRVKELLFERKIDLLFIDGDHTYDAVKADHENYAPLVRSGGFVAFHDISGEPGVAGYWDDLTPAQSGEAISGSGIMGLGWYRKP